jgi:hypothetical protein
MTLFLQADTWESSSEFIKRSLVFPENGKEDDPRKDTK